jgi:hypothetical protein
MVASSEMSIALAEQIAKPACDLQAGLLLITNLRIFAHLIFLGGEK